MNGQYGSISIFPINSLPACDDVHIDLTDPKRFLLWMATIIIIYLIGGILLTIGVIGLVRGILSGEKYDTTYGKIKLGVLFILAIVGSSSPPI